MNVKNLQLLADYLKSLPENYGHFNMSVFNDDDGEECGPSYLKNENYCGTAACAIGHAIYVKDLPNPTQGSDWFEYSECLFGLPRFRKSWEWCFSTGWVHTDNSPSGAAKRIEYLIEKGGDLDEWDHYCDEEALEIYEH